MPDWRGEIEKSLKDLRLDPAREIEILEELNQHLTDRYEDLVASGMPPAKADAAVRQELSAGKLASALQGIHATAPRVDESAGGVFAGLWKDLRHGARLLRLNPGFAAVAVLSLVLGIGANTALFQLIDAVRLRSLPVQRPEQIALIKIVKAPHGRMGGFFGETSQLTSGLWESIRSRQQGFSQVAAWFSTRMNLNLGGEARLANVLLVSGDFFDTLGVEPAVGRLLHEADDRKGCAGSGAVISDAFWHREYGGAADVIGRKITLDGQPFEVIGITSAAFYGIEIGKRFDVAVPACAEPRFSPEHPKVDNRMAWWLASIGRLREGWTLEKASAQLSGVSRDALEETMPDEYDSIERGHYLEMQLGALPAGAGFDSYTREYERPLWLLMGISGLVLLIACGNLANLMLARAGAREREMAVRLALGASRLRLIRQLLAESFLLVCLGAAGGALLARILSRTLVSFLNTQQLSLFLDLHMDWRVFAFTAALAVLTCLLFGLAPAIHASRTSPQEAMKAGSRGITTGRERFGIRRALVVSQVALSLVLLVGALLFVRTFRNLMTQDAGFRQDGILITFIDYSSLRIPAENRAAYRRDLLERVRSVPGVLSAATVSIVPVTGSGWNNNIDIPDTSIKRQLANFNRVSPGYFRTVGTSLLSGRDFDDHDTAQSPLVAIVTETFSRKFLNGANPVGMSISVPEESGKSNLLYRIVGLVRDVKYSNLRDEFTPIIFLADAQAREPETEAGIMVRTERISSAIENIKPAMAAVNPALVLRFRVFELLIREGLLRERLMASLSGFFAFLATVLAMIGLYGVISYTVLRRRNEIGIRMALGASARTILVMVLREATVLLGIGAAIGGFLAYIAGSAARALLYGLEPGDPATLAMAVAALTAVAALASYLPAHRAATVDPCQALREE